MRLGILKSGKRVGQNISYLQATDTPFIEQELRRLAAGSKSGKVTIVAHSNGGLVAKALMQKIGDSETAKLVDKVILVASPQVGTPQAIAGLLHGSSEGIFIPPFFTHLTDSAAREIGDTMPGLYTLLPSAAYFTSVSDPVVTFGTSSPPSWIATYGQSINSQSAEQTFLTDSTRLQPSVSDLFNPTTLNGGFVADAEAAHQSVDAWTPPLGVQLIQIAGWGVPNTVSGINYVQTLSDGHLTVYPDPQFTIDGDGTVVVSSALWTSTSTGAGVRDYWVDLASYNTHHQFTTIFDRIPFTHANILETDTLRDILKDFITESIKPVGSYTYLTTGTPSSNGIRLKYALHSPLTLNLYDSLGRHTGISTTTSEVDEEIPGTYYGEFAGVKYIFADASTSAHVVMNGEVPGTFTFNIDQYQGDTHTASTTFANIPTTAQTKVTLNVQSDITTVSPMQVDENGDGAADLTLVPKLNDVVTVDTTAPTATASVTGTLGNNQWYTSSVLVFFSATDTESGVQSTLFSLDGAATTTGTSVTISSEGVHTLSFYSVDNAGNTEAPHAPILGIDKTAPEAKLAFNPVTQALDIMGIDALSSTTVQTTATSSLVTVAAGHTLLISFTVSKVKAGRIMLSLAGLTYDGVATSSLATLKYKWSTEQKPNVYSMFAAYIKTLTTKLETHYRPRKDKTILMLNPVDLDDSDNDDGSDARPVRLTLPGMVVPYILTSRGVVRVVW